MNAFSQKSAIVLRSEATLYFALSHRNCEDPFGRLSAGAAILRCSRHANLTTDPNSDALDCFAPLAMTSSSSRTVSVSLREANEVSDAAILRCSKHSDLTTDQILVRSCFVAKPLSASPCVACFAEQGRSSTRLLRRARNDEMAWRLMHDSLLF